MAAFKKAIDWPREWGTPPAETLRGWNALFVGVTADPDTARAFLMRGISAPREVIEAAVNIHVKDNSETICW